MALAINRYGCEMLSCAGPYRLHHIDRLSAPSSTSTFNRITSNMSLVDYITSASAGLPAAVTSADKVYKDDCMYSFDTAENNPSGLDVCMSCFQAFARAAHKNYTGEHYTEKRHPLYVNIVRALKPESERKSLDEERERQNKVPKLEIVAQKDSDIYDTTTSIYVAPRDESLPIDECSPSVRNLATDILNANSASVNDDIKTWEQEVFPCEHSASIETLPKSQHVDLTQCASCDLKENLWICLTCGALGCGRQQFGSSLRGNSHALAHYEASGHQVAVKLGSLSADDADNCDCYCYQCNDEVKVPDLAAKLYPFGVDLSSAVKSEKSLIEMNLDTNKTWQFNLDDASGEKLAPVFGPGLTGLQNLGNSCYLNSVVQSLFSLDAYRDFFREMSFDKTVANPALHLPSQMIKLHDGLLSGRYSKPNVLKGDEYQTGIKPSTLKTLLGADHPEFKTNKQQDANEFLLYLFDKLDREFGLRLNKDFKFLLGSKVICTECFKGSYTETLVDNLSVPLEETVVGVDENNAKIYEETDLIASFRKFHSDEIIENYKCESCDKLTNAIRQEGFRTFPRYLVVSLQRIKLVNWVPVKQEIPVSVPESIDLEHFTSPSTDSGDIEIKRAGSESETSEFVPNPEALSMLLGMGFSEPRCLRGLYNTGNTNAEDAMNWIFAHMEDSDIDDPFVVPSSADSIQTVSDIPQESIDGLVSMGFSEKLAKKALLLNTNDMNASVEWLFSNPTDDGTIEEFSKPAVNLVKETEELSQQLANTDAERPNGNYKLKAAICHKGASPHTGHYVAFIKSDGHWFQFNDEKVVQCDNNVEDIVKNAYIYFFEKN